MVRLDRVGVGPPPIESPDRPTADRSTRGVAGDLHGVRDTVASALYRVGLILLDLDNPSVVRARTPEWLIGPTEPYDLTAVRCPSLLPDPPDRHR
jgi:predicted GH43/DUF377 family glycosyl hydrolase